MTVDPSQLSPRRSDLIVGYVLKMFPRFSETFILNEILELRRRGVRIHIFSMKAPNEKMRQPRATELADCVRVIPPLRGRGLALSLPAL